MELPGTPTSQGFSCSSVDKESACNTGDLGSIPGLGRFPGEGNGNPLQYSCLENPTDRGAWPASPWRCQESDTTEQLNQHQQQPVKIFLKKKKHWEGGLTPLNFKTYCRKTIIKKF